MGNGATFAHFATHIFGACPQVLGNTPKRGVKSVQLLSGCPLSGQRALAIRAALASCVHHRSQRLRRRRPVLVAGVYARDQIPLDWAGIGMD